MSATPLKDVISERLTIPAKTKYYYNLKITLVYSEEIDQTDDIKAKFKTGFTIEEIPSDASGTTTVNPSIESLNVTPRGSSIDVSVLTNEVTPTKFYYSLDNITFNESTSSSYIFENMTDGDYTVYAYFKDYTGKSSGVESKTVTVNTNLYTGLYADGYLKNADKTYNTSTSNATAYKPCEPNTTYEVTLYMDSRFRIFSYTSLRINATFTPIKYWVAPADKNDTTQTKATTTGTFTTGPSNTYLYIFCWTSGTSVAKQTVIDSIVIKKVTG